jgi:hypothetical protein
MIYTSTNISRDDNWNFTAHNVSQSPVPGRVLFYNRAVDRFAGFEHVRVEVRNNLQQIFLESFKLALRKSLLFSLKYD